MTQNNDTQNPRERLAALVTEAEENDYVDQNGKALPYLGWYWRDISGSGVRISWYDGQLWVNEPGKWGYPSTSVGNNRPEGADGYVPPEEYEPGDLDDMCDELADVVEKVIDQGGVLKEDREAYQRILHEYAGDVPVRWYRCTVDDCEEEFQEYISHGTLNGLSDHIEAEHDIDSKTPNRGEHYEQFVKRTIDTEP